MTATEILRRNRATGMISVPTGGINAKKEEGSAVGVLRKNRLTKSVDVDEYRVLGTPKKEEIPMPQFPTYVTPRIIPMGG